MCLSHDGDAQIVQGAPSTMLRMVPLPRCGRGGWGFARCVPLRGCGFEIDRHRTTLFIFRKFPSPCGDVLYSPPPSKRGRWRAVRAGRGACGGCDFLTMEMHRSFEAPLPPRCAWSPSPAVAGEAGVRVSVPLRGCGFEIHSTKQSISNFTTLFPSPCGDVVLKCLLRGLLK